MADKPRRHEARRFFQTVIAPYLKDSGLSLNEFSKKVRIDRGLMTRWDNGIEIVEPRHRDTIMDYISPPKTMEQVRKPMSMMEMARQNNQRLDEPTKKTVEDLSLKQIQLLLVKFTEHEKLNDRDAAEYIQALTGRKTTYGTVLNMKCGRCKPHERNLETIKQLLRLEDAITRFGVPDESEPLFTPKERKSKTLNKFKTLPKDEVVNLERVSSLHKPDKIDEEGLKNIGFKPQVLKSFDEIPLPPKPTPQPEKSSPPSSPYNDWANARLITTITSSEIMSEAEKKVLLRQLFPHFFKSL